jgi:hypothetical protein
MPATAQYDGSGAHAGSRASWDAPKPLFTKVVPPGIEWVIAHRMPAAAPDGAGK